MNNDPQFYNKDGSLTAYSFACGYIENFKLQPRESEHGVYDFETSLSAANTSISLWDIKGSVGSLYDYSCFWIQTTGLKNARRLYSKSRALLRKVYSGKLTREEYVQKMKEAEALENERQMQLLNS